MTSPDCIPGGLHPCRNPAHRHGCPGAGWYLETSQGWRPLTDTEAANERYEGMRHFMRDPREAEDGPVRYQVPVSRDLLDAQPWEPVDGFRMVTTGGPWPGHPGMVLCTFEDDGAPASLAGKLVDVTLSEHQTEAGHRTIRVSDRTEIGAGG